MAVETNEGGGAGTEGELLARAEMEMKKAREMGGEIEHIACRDGEDNDGSGTDCSFVMVMNGVDSDARSDSSEKDLEMDVRGCGGGAGDLLVADSGSTFVEDVSVEESKGDNGVERQGNEGEEERNLGDSFSAENEGKDDVVVGGEDDARDGEVADKILSMPVELEEFIDESVKTDHAQKEEEHEEMVAVDAKQDQVEGGFVAVEDSKDEKDAVIEELNNKDENREILKTEKLDQVGEELVMVEDSKHEKDIINEGLYNVDEAIDPIVVEDLKNKELDQVEEEVVIVADSKNEKEAVIEYLNKEDEVIMGTEEQVSEGTEVPYAKNEVESDSEGFTIGASSAQSSSSGFVDRNIKFELPIGKSDAVESAVMNNEAESVPEIEELKEGSKRKTGDVESSITEKKEADSTSEIEERRDVNNEVALEINSSELAKEEISSVHEIECSKDENHEECEDVDSLLTDLANEGVDSNSEVDEVIKGVESSKEEISSVFDTEDGRDDNREECEDVESLVRDAATTGVDSILEVVKRKNTNIEVINDVESEIADHMDDEVDFASEVIDRKIANDDFSNCIDWENEKNSVTQVDETLQVKATSPVSDDESGELVTPVELVKQHDVNASLQKFEIEEKEHDSSIELIDEPFMKDSGSAPIVEEYQAAEVSSIGQSTEPVKEFISSTSRVVDEYDATLSTSSNPEPSNQECVSASEAEEDKNTEMLFIASSPEHKEDVSFAPIVEEKQNLDASFIDSNTEPIKLLASTFEEGELKAADAPSIDSIPEPVKEVVGLASNSEENQSAEALVTEGENEKRELESATELADGVSKPVKALEEMEDRRKDLNAEEKSVESSRTEIVHETRDLKSDTELAEHKKIYLEKSLGEIEEQQMELKSEEKLDALNIQQQGNAAPSAQDGDVEKAEMAAKKYRLIKIPRFTQRVINDEQQAKITDAQAQVDEHTRKRDSLKAELDNMRKVLSDCFHKRDSTNEEEKKAKALVNAKRLEMDSIQTVISKGKTAASFLDIISRIHTLEHKMQHETISLKDEKKYLHELNQLKHERELHPFNKCSQLEIDDALKQKETAESSLKILKKEFDTLRNAHLKADECLKSVGKSYIDQFNKVKEHEQKWKTANELRQNAYKNLHGLKSDKMEHYWKYMDDRQVAKKYASSKDKEALERHCTEQVERIMQLWNEDDDFRKQYVESNVSNTLRKFGTLDGRTPCPNDPKLVIPQQNFPPLTSRSSPTTSTVQNEQSLHSHKVTKPALPTNLMVRSKSPLEPTSNDVAAAFAPSREEFVEEKKLTKEEEEQARIEEEQARKEEELRKVREELELKEKLRMEQKAKAKEAEERKRRKAEKAQAKAEYKAQKQTELRELKRLKKEKKKDGIVEGDIASVTETSSQEASQEQENNNNTTSSKRIRRKSSAALNKYSNKVQPVPLPLRNRGKRKMTTWIWIFCVAVALMGLFFAGNYISFSFSWVNFGF